MVPCHRRGDPWAPAPYSSPWAFAAVLACLLLAGLFPGAVQPQSEALPVARSGGPQLAEGRPSDDLFSAVGASRARRISAVVGDFESGCLPAGAQGYDTAERASLSRLAAVLQLSDLGRTLLRQARFRAVLLCVDPATELLGYYRSQMRFIALNAGLSEARRIVFLAHELGHVPQHPRFSDNRYFPPEDLILLRRMREAAAEAVATRILWQLRQNGYAQAWRQKLVGRYGDISRAFRAAWDALPGDPERELKATRAAFDQWFERRWRLNFYDHQSLRHLERIAADETGLVPARFALRHDFLVQIAWLGGENYLLRSDGHRLLHARYRAGLSQPNQGRLREIQRRARWGPRPVSERGGRDLPLPRRF